MRKKQKIGLALGSGAARGIAHLGVLKELERKKIQIDYIAGSSIGALVGALYCAQGDTSQIEKIIKATDWRLFLSLLDPFSSKGIIRGEKIKKFLKKFLGDSTLESLKIPLVIVATDYHTGKPVYFQKGNLVDAIMASCAIPVIFEPIKIKNKVLVDGGLSVPLPVSQLKKMGATKVIAVNLDGDFFSYRSKKYSIGDSALRAINLLRYHLAETMARDADVVISPKVGDIIGYDFLSGEKVVKAGIVAARKKIKDIIN